MSSKIIAFVLHFVSLGLSTYLTLRKERQTNAGSPELLNSDSVST